MFCKFSTLKSIVSSIALLSLSLTDLVNAKPAYGQGQTLVIGDSDQIPEQYSQFFDNLKAHEGITLKFAGVRDDSIDLIIDNDLEYDNLIILPTRAKSLGPHLKTSKLLEYFNAGGNLLAITDSTSSPESLFEFFKELDINISPRGYKTVDHFSYSKSKSSSKHDLLELTSESHYVNPRVVGADANGKPILFSGAGAFLGNNPSVVPILKGTSTSYVYDPSDDGLVLTEPWTASGSQTYFAAGFQGLNNARAVWLGGDSFISNTYVKDKTIYNAEFADAVAKWAFKETGVIRNTFVLHEPADNNTIAFTSFTSGFPLYKINQNIKYTAGFQEWTGEKWVPFVTDDIQVEFVMLNPYYRLTLGNPVSETPEGGAIYSVTFKIPDQHGIFTFHTDYKRPGLTFVENKNTVTVRHNANDEWPRSWEITNSWIYLTSFVIVLFSWGVFVIFYLYSDDGKPFSETWEKIQAAQRRQG